MAATFSLLGYGSPRPYVDYHDLIRILHNADLTISSYKPIRWAFKYDNFWNKFEDGKKDIAKMLYNAVPDRIKQEIEMHVRTDGAQAMIYNCFVLSANKVSDRQVIQNSEGQKINIDAIDINTVWEVWD